MDKFNPIAISSKFAICGLPIRIDTYKTCSFGCKYCFSNCRQGVMEFEKTLKIANLSLLEKRLKKIFKDKNINKSDMLDLLISKNITWHCGGMSDPFQPIEKKLQITSQLIKLTKEYNIDILFSTKTDDLYESIKYINPKLHSFQLSVTNVNNRKDLEPNVSSINKRYKLYRWLKNNGYKVGIRIQPFIPNVSNIKILEMFDDADHFVLEGLKLVPTNKEHRKYLLDLLNLQSEDFTQMGLLNLKPEIRVELYKPFLEWFKKHDSSYSLADNDMHQYGNNLCCCGDNLVKNSTTFNTTYLNHVNDNKYNKSDVIKELKYYKIDKCNCSFCFTSNRRPSGDGTCKDYINDKFEQSTSPLSPKFLYFSEKLEDKK